MKLKNTANHYRLDESGRISRETKSGWYSFVSDRKVKKFIQRNLQSLGNLIDHASGHIIFPSLNSPNLFTGISNKKSQVLLGHFSCQSQFPHPVSKGIQKIFVYHILHIQEWKFKKDHKSPYMGYFYVFDYFCLKEGSTSNVRNNRCFVH